jgi:hypothetical protein
VSLRHVSAAPLALSAIWSIFGWLLKFGLGDGGLATRERLHYGRYRSVMGFAKPVFERYALWPHMRAYDS